jgi:hypothetical protein
MTMTEEQSPKHSNGFQQKVTAYFRWSNNWFFGTPERALAQAYSAAQKIKSIEDKYFNGGKIDLDVVNYGQSNLDCFQADLEKNLNIIKIKLAEFKVSRLLLKDDNYLSLEKLNQIDRVLNKYQLSENSDIVVSQIDDLRTLRARTSEINGHLSDLEAQQDRGDNPYISQKTEEDNSPAPQGLLPRSIGKTFKRIQTEMDGNSEEVLVQKFRNSKRNTKLAIRFFLLLVIIPLLTQQLTKQFLVLPLVEQLRARQEAPAFLNYEMKEKAIEELKIYEEGLRFNYFLDQSPRFSEAQIEKKIKEKANKINRDFQKKSNIAVSNVFADLFGLLAFAMVVLTNKKGIIATKAFLNTIIYDLSDSAKAFIIILFTDVFVGFHSPHGWEVILENLAAHLGLPASRDAIFIFISTFPVILDTVCKYWIFRYLNQISPSAVATLKNMNE